MILDHFKKIFQGLELFQNDSRNFWHFKTPGTFRFFGHQNLDSHRLPGSSGHFWGTIGANMVTIFALFDWTRNG
jgi:hypothetical protein